MVEIIKTQVDPIVIVEPPRFGDHRGFFSETFRESWEISAPGLPFRQDNHAYSASRGTVRGLHFQTGPSVQAKLLRVVQGAILDVAVDIRRGSPTYGKWVAEELSAENGRQLFVPHGFAHGYATLGTDCHVLYKVDNYYDGAREGALFWDDPEVGIPWPDFGNALAISDKDAAAPRLADFSSPFVYDPAAPYHCRCE